MKKIILTIMALIALSTVSFAEVNLKRFNLDEIKTTEQAKDFGHMLKNTNNPISDCENIPSYLLIKDCKRSWQQNYIVPLFLPSGNNR